MVGEKGRWERWWAVFRWCLTGTLRERPPREAGWFQADHTSDSTAQAVRPSLHPRLPVP